MLPPITRHETAGGIRIYRIPMQVFPHLLAYAHVVIAGSYVALLDVGSGLGQSNEHLFSGFEALREDWGERLTWRDVSRIVITHAHIDHYGGLSAVRGLCDAPIAVHALDQRVISNHRERLILGVSAVANFLHRAGVKPELHRGLLRDYGWSKELFISIEVTTILEDGDRLDDMFSVFHTPGHCSGQVCLLVDDVMLTADHVLPGTSLYLSPESIMPSMGVEHYFNSLRYINRVPDICMALGGHGEPMGDMYAIIAQIESFQRGRLARVLDACREPHTIAELTSMLYPNVSGYDTILALGKVGAYVEYLDQRGTLSVENLEQVAAHVHTAPRYRRV